MYHLLHRGLISTFLFSALVANQADAQDILASTGVSTRSYSYIEAEYVVNSDQETPIIINGLVDIARGFALTGRYTNQRDQFTSDVDSFSGDATLDLFTVGLLYHNQLFELKNTDWFAEIGVGRLQLQVDTEAVKLTQGINVALLSGGVRHTVTERLELELATNFLIAQQTDVSNQNTDFTVSARGVFRVTRNFDVALSLTEVPTANIIGLGLRFTF